MTATTGSERVRGIVRKGNENYTDLGFRYDMGKWTAEFEMPAGDVTVRVAFGDEELL